MNENIQKIILTMEAKNIKDKNDILSEFSDFKKDVLTRVQTEAELNAFKNRDAFVKGDKGDKGDTPSDEHIVDLIKPLIPEPLDGKDGTNGKDGKDGKNGTNGKDGVNGKDGSDGLDGLDGSPDTPKEIVSKLNTLENVVDWKVLKDFKSLVNQDTLTKAVQTLENQTRFLIQSNSNKSSGGGGVQTIVAGANISVDSTDPENPIVTSLSDRYKTTSTTSQAIVSTGTLTFTVDANLAYTPQQDVMIVYDNANHMHGTVNSYSGTTLVVDITHKTGSGTYASWTINLDGLPVGGSGWELTGNAGTNPATNFIGTTDNQPLVFRTNNIDRGRIFTSGNIGINTTTDSGASLRINRSDYGTMLEMLDGYYGYYFGINLPTSPRGDRLHIWKNSSQAFYNNQGGGHSLLINGNSIFRIGTGDGGVNKNIYLNETGGGNTLIGTTTDAGYKLDVTGTGIFRSTAITDKPLIIRGFSGQTANMQEWQDSAGTALLSVDSAGALQSYQATGAKTFFKHTRNDGEAAKIYTSDGYNLWIQGGNGGALHLGNPGGGGLSHSTTVYGGEQYFSTAFNTRSAIRVIGMVDRYGDSTQSDLEVQLTSHLVSDSGAYNSSAIFRGKTIKGYLTTKTITDASTVRIDAAPTAGTNATLTNTWALHVVAGASKFGGPIQLPGYTVATLPAGKVGYCAYVTDALAPVALANVVGGGAVTVKVFYDGTNWIVQ